MYYRQLVLIVGLVCLQQAWAQTPCTSTNCVLPDCRCMGTSSPGNLDVDKTPQLIFLTFEDAITINNYNNYSAILSGRKNPNDCPISMTFYVNHRNNDYVYTHSLYWMGNEMASKTISDTELSSDTWAEMGTTQYTEEIGGQRDILNIFANIPKSSVKGFRAPNLQTNGNFTFDALSNIGMTFDNSFSTVNNRNPGIWPYTLDYGFQHDCQDAKGKCPTATYPGIWIVPMIVLDYQDRYCAMADACPKPANALETKDYLMNNFFRTYNSNRAPLGIYLHSAWFQGATYTLSGYMDFLDEVLKTYNDVYVVSVGQGIDWIKNPTPLGSTQTAFECPTQTPSQCVPRTCYYVDYNTGDDIVMRSCVPCPDSYPEPGNPEGIGRRIKSLKEEVIDGPETLF